MAEVMDGIRYTAAVAKCRGNYKHISDIADDVPIYSMVDYWNDARYAKPFHPTVPIRGKFGNSASCDDW